MLKPKEMSAVAVLTQDNMVRSNEKEGDHGQAVRDERYGRHTV
jgi:hypothetical protein